MSGLRRLAMSMIKLNISNAAPSNMLNSASVAVFGSVIVSGAVVTTGRPNAAY